jgi:hypothetical protein
MAGGLLAGFVDWDTASPSRREDDLAFSALTWVPLLTAEIAEGAGFGDAAARHLRFHLPGQMITFLDGYITIKAYFLVWPLRSRSSLTLIAGSS